MDKSIIGLAGQFTIDTGYSPDEVDAKCFSNLCGFDDDRSVSTFSKSSCSR